MSDYPADILVEVDWLKDHLGDPNLRILDTRASDPRLPVGYRMGHIPGAIALDVGRDFFVFDGRAPQLASAEQIGQTLSRLGISNDARVVIYDEWTGQLVSFTYWVLRYVGHRDLKILHGGWAAWQKGKGEVCPCTFVKSKLALEMLEANQVLQVVVDNDESATNVPKSMTNEGHTVLGVEKINGRDWLLTIKKR